MASKVTRKTTNCVIYKQPKVLSSSTLPSYEDVIRACQFERITLLEISRMEPAFSTIFQLAATSLNKNLELCFNTDCVAKACQKYDQ